MPQTISEPPRYVREGDAARHLSMSSRTLRRLRVQRTGPDYMRNGRSITYDIKDLDAWARSQKIKHSKGKTP